MGRKLDEDDVIRVMCQRIVGVSEERARIIASHIPTAEPSASDCWSNDNRPTNDSIVTKSSRYSTDRTTDDTISRQVAIDAIQKWGLIDGLSEGQAIEILADEEKVPSAQPARVWTPCDIPPEHHRDVIVRGVEAIGNVTVHNIMQWDVDKWRPENYAPSITWLDWSEI